MRFFTNSILLCSALVLGTCGCRSNNATLRCERETALLRAEILDLEDKYYALKSQYESAVPGGAGTVVTSGVVGSGIVSSPVIVGSSPMVHSAPMVQGEFIQGDVIYDDQMIPGTIHTVPTPAAGGGVYYEGQALPMGQSSMGQPVIGQPVIGQQVINQGVSPTPAVTDPGPTSLETPSASESTTTDQTLMLPEDPELEVGYEDLDLDLANGEVDRLEIVSSATRGKDLDGVPGHDGIELLVKTVNSDGEFVEQSGELTVTVKDQLAGEIAKWTFLPEELKLFLSRDELGNIGTLLHLPWTDKIPVSKQVEVRVSMMINDVEYIASLNVDIEPPTGQSQSPAIVGWAVDDERWVSSAPTTSQSSVFSSPTLRAAPKPQPTPSIERPVWKPVR